MSDGPDSGALERVACMSGLSLIMKLLVKFFTFFRYVDFEA